MFNLNFVYALAAGIIPSLIWLFFWTREDHEQPEPRSLLAACFIGGMIAVIASIPIEQMIAGITSDPSHRYIFWAITEEVLKFIVVAIVALRTRSYDQPIDAMIYFITAALGFAALENALFILGPLSGGNIVGSLVTGNMRFIGATLVHVVSSALIGFGMGLSFYRGKLAKFAGWFVGLGAALSLHIFFNLAISNADSMDTLRTFGWIWGAVVVLIVLFEEVKVVRQNPAP
ncbi:MAG: PrsW family glutamic-type intramembrane protease [Candidatus Paceibacterota bacterium]